MECSSAGAAVNNITSPSTTESNSEITDYVSAFLDPPDCGSSKAVSFRVVGGFPASLGTKQNQCTLNRICIVTMQQ